jgi:hypothetical protein
MAPHPMGDERHIPVTLEVEEQHWGQVSVKSRFVGGQTAGPVACDAGFVLKDEA